MTHIKFLGDWKPSGKNRWVRHYRATYGDGFTEQSTISVVSDGGGDFALYYPSNESFMCYSDLKEAMDAAEDLVGTI